MFLKPQMLKRMMKAAYKGSGLILAATEERYYISGYWWELDVKKEFLTKTIAAQIIELAGEFPEIGERFQAKESGNQLEVCGRMEVETKENEEEVEVTKLILQAKTDVPQRLIQTYAGKILLVNNAVIEMLSNKEVDYNNGEHEYIGPVCDNEMKAVLFWNNAMRFKVYCRIDDENERILRELEQINLMQEQEG